MTASLEVVLDLNEHPPGSPEWARARQSGIGGSLAGAVAGVSRFKTPYQAWVELTRDPEAITEPEKEVMTWGKLLEAPVREEFTRRTGIEAHPVSLLLRNKAYPWMIASPDGVTGPLDALNGIYEGKTTRFADAWEADDNGATKVPLEYATQGMHYLAVTGFDVVHFACLIGGQELRVAEIERNEHLIEDLIAIEEVFWQRVIDRLAPPVLAADRSTLARQFGIVKEGKVVELGKSARMIFSQRAQLVAQAKELTEQVDQIDAVVMASLGDAEVGTVAGEVAVTWKSATSRRIDTKALKEAHPALAAEFTRTTTSRRFLPKELST
jgi:putative phage-type endonuclease